MRATDPPRLDAATRLRLAKLLGMVGSSGDGEALNAARLADRLVREHGATWHDVVDASALPGIGPQPDINDDDRVPIETVRSDWRRAAMWCLRQGGPLLRDRDRDFLRVIGGYTRRPSEAQFIWLEGLVDRIHGEGDAS